MYNVKLGLIVIRFWKRFNYESINSNSSYNEGENILLALEEIDKIKKYAEITILICYDFDDDNTLSSINSSNSKTF